MSEFNKTPRLVLLPAVDVAGGKAVRLTQGEAGTETNYGDPVDAAADWADQGAEWIHLVDLDAAFGRGSNAGHPEEGHPPGARRQRRALRRHPRRRVARARARDRRQAHQPRHRRAREPRVGGIRHRAVRRGHRRRARRARHDARGPRLDARTAATCGRSRPPRGGRLQPATSSPTSPRTARCRARTSTCSARSWTAPHRPVVASGGISSLDDIAALRELVPLGARGRDRRQGAVRRRLHAGRGAGCRRH